MLIHSSSFSFFNLHNHHHRPWPSSSPVKEGEDAQVLLQLLLWQSCRRLGHQAMQSGWQKFKIKRNLKLFCSPLWSPCPDSAVLATAPPSLKNWMQVQRHSESTFEVSSYFCGFSFKIAISFFLLFPLQKYHCLKLQAASYKDLSPTEWRGPSILFCVSWKCICICLECIHICVSPTEWRGPSLLFCICF